MTGTLTHIWRHPIKSHGAEALKTVALTAGKTMPWDRVWAVPHGAAKLDGNNWVRCLNFSRGAKAPSLMAIRATLNEAAQTVTLSHPDLPEITFNPDTDSAEFLAWVQPIMPTDRTASAGILRVNSQGMTDTDFPSISINSHSTNNAVGVKLGYEPSPLRWRGNLWVDGIDPWEEFNWVGKRVRIGDAEFDIKERITRCLATTANPKTGKRDAATLDTLQDNWGHKQFGVYGVVVRSGQINLGDEIEVL